MDQRFLGMFLLLAIAVAPLHGQREGRHSRASLDGWDVVAGPDGATALFSAQGNSASSPTIARAAFGRTPDGADVSIYTLRSGLGVTVRVTDYGGIITSVDAPDRRGTPGDIVLGFDTLDPYVKGHPYFGALVGRVANRIAKGHFTMDGRTYTLAVNNGPNHLHGGLKGFDKVVWRADTSADAAGAHLRVAYTSADGEEGYPGNDLQIQDGVGVRSDCSGRGSSTACG